MLHAILTGKAKAVKTLLYLGADTSAKEKDGYGVLHAAAFHVEPTRGPGVHARSFDLATYADNMFDDQTPSNICQFKFWELVDPPCPLFWEKFPKTVIFLTSPPKGR